MTIRTYAVELEGLFNKDDLPKFFFLEYEQEEVIESTVDEYNDFCEKYDCYLNPYHKVWRSDGSIHINRQEYQEAFGDDYEEMNLQEGELASPIFRTINGVCKFIEDFLPYGNNSCSAHLHFKPEDGDYQNAIMNYKKFKDDYMNFLSYVGHDKEIPETDVFWARQKNSSQYSQWSKNQLSLQDVKNQMSQGGNYNARYRHVNFPFSKSGTIELRSLPIFKSKTLQKSITRDIFKYLNCWFLTCPNKAKKREINI